MTAPLVPADVDLQDFAFMPVDVRRLRDSDLAALETPEACWAAVLLWAASWHQMPAASLPDDDRVLSNLAGYGRVVKEWQRIKEGALRGWVKCDDGRLYHPVVAEKALEAWDSKLRHAHSKLKERLRKSYGREAIQPTFDEWVASGKPNDWQQSSAGIPEETPESSAGKKESSAGIPPENALNGEGQGEGQGKLTTTSLSAREIEPTRKGIVCGLLRSAGMADAAPHYLTDDAWKTILAKRTDEEIIEVARAKMAAMPNQRIGLKYIAKALMDDPQPITANQRGSPRMSHADASKLAAARAIFGTEIEGKQHGQGSEGRIIDITPGAARLVGG